MIAILVSLKLRLPLKLQNERQAKTSNFNYKNKPMESDIYGVPDFNQNTIYYP